MAESDKKTECVKVWMSERLFVDLNRLAILTIDHEIGRRLAEEGMSRTLDGEPGEWIGPAMAALRRFAREWPSFKIEDFRAWYLEQGFPPPHDHHVWGAFGNKASRANVIRWTGRYAISVSPKTHGHPVKVWTAA